MIFAPMVGKSDKDHGKPPQLHHQHAHGRSGIAFQLSHNVKMFYAPAITMMIIGHSDHMYICIHNLS